MIIWCWFRNDLLNDVKMVSIKTYSWNKWWQCNGKDFTWSMPTLFSLAFMHSTFTCMKKKTQKDGIVHFNMISKCNQQGIESFETWRGRLLWLWAYSRCLRASSRCSVSSWHRSSCRNNFCNGPMCNLQCQCAMGIIVKKIFSKRENQILTSERSSSLHSRMSRTRSPSRPVTLKVSLTDDPFIIPRFGWLCYNLLVFQSSWIRDGFPRKNCCSFGFCPNYTSPTLPTISTTCATFFWRRSKFKIWNPIFGNKNANCETLVTTVKYP